MRKTFLIIFLLLGLVTSVRAQLAVGPPDLQAILQKVGAHQGVGQGISPEAAAKFIFEGEQIILRQPAGGIVHSISFADANTTIVKHFNVGPNGQREGYRFLTALQQQGAPYQNMVVQVRGADALVFFNETEVFIYTQEVTSDGAIDLREWIYARQPNSPSGSQWTWIWKSEPWQWPLTLEMGETGEAKIHRHTPAPAWMPIAEKARSQYMLDMMIKVKKGERVNQYFPFKGEIGVIPPVQVVNKEGIQRQVDASVFNSSVVDENRPKPKHGLDFVAWNDAWQSSYTLSVTAAPSEYPLLIGDSH